MNGTDDSERELGGDDAVAAEYVLGTLGAEDRAAAARRIEADAAFARLAGIRAAFVLHHPEATILSAGMSGDLEEAVKHGATHVRVGSAVLGTRQSVK